MRQRDQPSFAAVGGTNPDSVYAQDEFEVGEGTHALISALGINGYQNLRGDWNPWLGATIPGATGWQDPALQRGGHVTGAPNADGIGWAGQLLRMQARVPTTSWAGLLYARVGVLMTRFPGFFEQRAAIIVATQDVLAGEVPFLATGIRVRPGDNGTFWGTYANSTTLLADEQFSGSQYELSTYVRLVLFYDDVADQLTVTPQVSPQDGLGWAGIGDNSPIPGNLLLAGFAAQSILNGPEESQGSCWCDYLRLEICPPASLFTKALISSSGGRNYP